MPFPIETPELTIARHAAEAAGAVLLEHFHRGVHVRHKGRVDLVTDADTDAERAIIDVIRSAAPDHAILAEESRRDDVDAEHLWVVDPLDGTTNFAHGLSHFAVSIAYYREGRAECGIVLDPVRDDWHVAARGAGAYRNGDRVHVADTARLDDALVATGFYYDRGARMEATLDAMRVLFAEDVRGIRRFGTASLDLCLVGTGVFAAFFEFALAPWDFAAGRLFVEEAGGRVTTCAGTHLPLAPTTILATNGRLHDTMMHCIGATAAPFEAATI